MQTLDSFWKRVNKEGPVSAHRPDLGPCWLWTGYLYKGGYGQIATRIKPTPSGTRLAHRVAYELVVGPIPFNLDLDHLCRNRACVNPQHLEPVTEKVNAERGLRGVLKETCPAGHSMAAEFIKVRPQDGARVCMACARISEVELADIAGERLGMHPKTLAARLQRGWSLEDAMSRPVRAGGNRKGSVFVQGQRRGASVRESYRSAGAM